MGVELRPIAIRNRSDIEHGIAAFARVPDGGLVVTVSGLTIVHRELIGALMVQYRLPAIYPYRYFVRVGGLVSYGPNFNEQFRGAAGYVDRILKDEKPADLPAGADQVRACDQPQNRQGARPHGLAGGACTGRSRHRMTCEVEAASNKPLERRATRIRSLAAAHWRRSAHHAGQGVSG